MISLSCSNFFCSLKRKSTAIAKRQSFLLETKPLRTNKSMVEQPKLPSKNFHTLVIFFILFFMPFLMRFPISVTGKKTNNIKIQFINDRL